MRENKLRCFGNVIRRDEVEAVRFFMKMNAIGKGKQRKPNKRWMDGEENVIRKAEVIE